MPRTPCPNGPTNTYCLTSPLGDLTLVTCTRGIHSLKPSSDVHFRPDLSVAVSIRDQTYQDNGYTYKPALLCVDWLTIYFSGSKEILRATRPALCLASIPYSKSSFSYRVWETLGDRVAYGTRVSYRQLAQLCNSPNAQQSVGTVMKNNPVYLIVPCHRVICSSGKAGFYGGGKRNPMKVWLLDYEARVCGTVKDASGEPRDDI